MTLFRAEPGKRWLFCLTHPDDEISICGWIRRLVEAGNPVFLSWTHHIPVREAEARQVAKILGVPQDHLFFHGGTDASICDELPQLLPSFQKMMSEVNPDHVACGAFEQGHLDHDGTNRLVHETFNGPVYEIPFYHTYLTRLQRLNRFSDPRGEEVWFLEPDLQSLKIEIARQYPSQNIWSVLVCYEAWQRMRGKPVELRRSERMRVQTHFDYRTPNHPPILAKRVIRSESWQRWLRAMDEFDKSLEKQEWLNRS